MYWQYEHYDMEKEKLKNLLYRFNYLSSLGKLSYDEIKRFRQKAIFIGDSVYLKYFEWASTYSKGDLAETVKLKADIFLKLRFFHFS